MMADWTKFAVPVAAICGYVWWKATVYPKWVDDLLLRAYSTDHMEDRGSTPESKAQFEEAAKIASRTNLPVGWVLHLMSIGGTLNDVAHASSEVIEVMQQMGPPVDCLPETLAQYRDKVLFAVSAGFEKAEKGRVA